MLIVQLFDFLPDIVVRTHLSNALRKFFRSFPVVTVVELNRRNRQKPQNSIRNQSKLDERLAAADAW